jgi:hypothetical protein
MGNGNWKHFGKFNSLSAIPTSNQGIDVVWNTIVALGSSVAIQGGPGLNPDGSPADGPITLAHSFARQWGDKTAYHVGANYAEQEGDTIVVSLGNSSTKRTGWANNVNDGISFATTTGGSFATTGGFSVNTIGGGRVQTFIGIEVNCSEAFTFKIAGGGVYEVFKTSKIDSVLQETSIIGTLTEICTSLNETVGSCRRVSLSQQSVANDVVESSVSRRVSTLGPLEYVAASIDTKTGPKTETQTGLIVTTIGDRTTVTTGVDKADALIALFLG